MNKNYTGKMRDRTNLKRLDSLTDEEIEQAACGDCCVGPMPIPCCWKSAIWRP